jgi:hypothetical protein
VGTTHTCLAVAKQRPDKQRLLGNNLVAVNRALANHVGVTNVGCRHIYIYIYIYMCKDNHLSIWSIIFIIIAQYTQMYLKDRTELRFSTTFKDLLSSANAVRSFKYVCVYCAIIKILSNNSTSGCLCIYIYIYMATSHSLLPFRPEPFVFSSAV